MVPVQTEHMPDQPDAGRHNLGRVYMPPFEVINQAHQHEAAEYRRICHLKHVLH